MCPLWRAHALGRGRHHTRDHRATHGQPRLGAKAAPSTPHRRHHWPACPAVRRLIGDSGIRGFSSACRSSLRWIDPSCCPPIKRLTPSNRAEQPKTLHPHARARLVRHRRMPPLLSHIRDSQVRLSYALGQGPVRTGRRPREAMMAQLPAMAARRWFVRSVSRVIERWPRPRGMATDTAKAAPPPHRAPRPASAPSARQALSPSPRW